MEKRRLDLVHELQAELAWDPDFAAGAYREYKRWLHLRVQAGDFMTCKLPPSRVVSLVWGMHRNWTYDYERTCADLGGYIHHYPPAMRMNMGREQAYAATVHLYKNTYREDPPSTYWGAAICAYKPLSGDVEMANVEEPAAEEKDPPPPRVTPTSRRASARRDSIQLRSSPPAAKSKEKPTPEPPTRRPSYSKRAQAEEASTTEKPRTSQAEDMKPGRRGPKSAKETKHATSQTKSVEEEENADAQQPVMKGRGRKRLSGSSQVYVLRPLRPGEKRKRGRPSFSDYMLLSDVNKTPASTDSKKKDQKASAPEKGSASKTAERSAPPTLRRRRSVASPAKLTSPAPVIAKTTKGQKSVRRGSRAVAAAATSATGKNASVSTNTTNKKAEQAASAQEPKDTVPLKRPRGRPRKDGSWPVARSRQNEAATKRATTSNAEAAKSASKQAAEKPSEPQPKRATAGESKKTKAATPSSGADKPKGRTQKAKRVVEDEAPSEIIQGDVQMTNLTEKPKASTVDKTPRTEALEKEVAATQQQKENPANDSHVGPKGTVPTSGAHPGASAQPSATGTGVSTQMSDGNQQGSNDQSATAPVGVEGMNTSVTASQAIGPGTMTSGPLTMVTGAMSSAALGTAAMSSIPMATGVTASGPLGSGPLTATGLSAGSTPGTSAAYPVTGTAMTGPKANNFGVVGVKAVPIAPAPPVSGVTSMGTVHNVPGVPPISSVPASSTVPAIPSVPGFGDTSLPSVVTPIGGKVAMDTAIGITGLQTEDGEGKRPFRRPRGRPRREPQWSTQKPVSEEAVEKVKDLNDTALNFPMGPPGAV